MKLIIAGSRSINDEYHVLEALDKSDIEINTVTMIISGGANGVDSMAEDIAHYFHIPFKLFPADWSKYGKRAGMIRNNEMARYGDNLVSVWDGKSKGSQHMIDAMKKLSKPVYIHILGD